MLRAATVVTLLALTACGSPPEGAPRPYPFDTCLVSDEFLGAMGDPVTKVHEGRELRFCCAACVATFESDPATFLAKLPR